VQQCALVRPTEFAIRHRESVRMNGTVSRQKGIFGQISTIHKTHFPDVKSSHRSRKSLSRAFYKRGRKRLQFFEADISSPVEIRSNKCWENREVVRTPPNYSRHFHVLSHL